MKNVTITLDEETARWARIQAARRNTSVSRMLGEVLQEMRDLEEQRGTAAERFLGRPTGPLRETDMPYPDRESLYDRPLLR
ncbi:hypothetical protein HFP89_14850 [Wenzhouxiangella sp. XN79A]|uniref:hypothetical protein n=1 Tax=Wenzhouxiangella sp. XN79A TaxID=2724193 RepID=UPI00144A9619|nr:hypothetical protein [Wenzhouxiangella sp. XN79A]NKI36447.1 hypothetical protein [Wenzhouxiangella sp. XN79A]